MLSPESSLIEIPSQVPRKVDSFGNGRVQTKEKLLAIADHVPALIAYIDCEQRYQFANEAFRTWFGFDPDAMIGCTVEEVFGPTLAARAQDRIQRALAGETVYFQTVLKTGETMRAVAATYAPDFADDGTIEGLYLTVNDVTEQERASQALQELTALQVAILDSANFAIIATDVQGLIWTFNSTAERWLGYRVEEVLGHAGLPLFLDPAELAARQRELEPKYGRPITSLLDWVQAATQGTLKTHDEREWTLLRKDGTRFPVALSLNVLRDGAGEINGILGVARDNAAEKAAEGAQRRAREAAELASRTKSQFLAHMSHEVRTPLHGIAGVTGMLLKTPLNEVQRPLAEAVHASVEALLGVVSHVLDFSKVEAGKLVLEKKDFSPAALLRDVVRLHAVRADGQGVVLNWQAAPSVPQYVSGDSDRLHQIVHNLVGNAVKFTDQGSVDVRVELEPSDAISPPVGEGHVRLRFSVTDDGIGIPPEAQVHIFEPFAQADESTCRRFGGTGLGLAIVRELVELMGGEVGVISTPGVGSTFWFTAVFGEVNAESIAAPNSGEVMDIPGENGTASRKLNVLLVEDSEVNRIFAQHQLRQWDCALTVVECGLAAITAAKREHFDLILMDCLLPDLDGYSVTERIRHDEEGTGRRACIVALTASTDAGERARCLDAGMDEYLPKPFHPSQLAVIVRAAAVLVLAPGTGGPIGEAALACLREAHPSAGQPLFVRLVSIFERESPVTLEALADAASRGDIADIEIAAHKLKGASSNFGAVRLQQLCQLVEDLCHEGQSRFIHWLLPEIDTELRAVLEALQTSVDKGCQNDRAP